MKKLFFYVFIVLFFSNIGWTESLLPKCKGSNYEQWTNCQGTELWENGRKYVGKFIDGKRQGQGIMTHPDGAKYIGQWKDGLPHGKGIETWEDGTKYVGEYKSGNKIGHGEGSLRYPDGTKFVGKFEDGLPKGVSS